MLAQYKKTFVGTQILVGFITLGVLVRTHRPLTAFVFFSVMQIGAVIGALWAAQLKRRIETARLNRA